MHQTLVSPLLKKEDLNAHSQSISTHYKSEESSQRYITGKENPLTTSRSKHRNFLLHRKNV